MTNETEAVAEALCMDAGCVWDLDTATENRAEWRRAAQAAITTLDRHRIERAGELCTALKFHGRYGSENRDQMTVRKNGEREQAAATIASLRAEIERLTERADQAKLDGVRAGIEAAAQCADHLGGGRVERNPDGSLCTYDMASKYGQGSATLNAMRVRAQTIATAIRALSAEAIAKGEG